MINCIQNKGFCLHNKLVCIYIYITFVLNVYMHVCVFIYTHDKYTQYTGIYHVNTNFYFGYDYS